jgi:diaminopimelate decarboxylase
MNHFHTIHGILHAEATSLERIAQDVGTPVYIYSQATLERHAQVFSKAVAQAGDTEVAFAVKANPNLAVLHVLAKQGLGADVVSGGELKRALRAGVHPNKIVFSGVGKSDEELRLGLENKIGQFNIESIEEGLALSALAVAHGVKAQAVLRINPDVDAKTHEKISTGKAENKFGVPMHHAAAIYTQLAACPGLAMRGLALHIGSMIADLSVLQLAYEKTGALAAHLRQAGHNITHIDLGGGLGVPYKPEDVYPSPQDYGAMVQRVTQGWGVKLMFEPGRLIAANAGVLLTRVIRVKQGAFHPFIIVDAAMNDLARPSLYDAYHHFAPVRETQETWVANIVGPICETGDTFARNRSCAQVQAGELAVFYSAGAYGATMASTYNSRSLVPEVLVHDDRFEVVADRIDATTLIDAERVPDWM